MNQRKRQIVLEMDNGFEIYTQYFEKEDAEFLMSEIIRLMEKEKMFAMPVPVNIKSFYYSTAYINPDSVVSVRIRVYGNEEYPSIAEGLNHD